MSCSDWLARSPEPSVCGMLRLAQKEENSKPSVDSSIQVRLYRILPEINYIVHAHCYAEGAPFTFCELR